MPINAGRTQVLVVEHEQDIAGLIKHALERKADSRSKSPEAVTRRSRASLRMSLTWSFLI